MSSIDRVLSTRIEAMERALDRLRKLSDDVSEARRGLDELNTQIWTLAKILKTASSMTTQLRGGLEQISESLDLYETTRNENYQVSAEELRGQLQTAIGLEAALKDLRNSVSIKASMSIARLRRWSPVSSANLDKVAIDDDTARELESALGKTATDDDPWGYFRKEVQSRCDDIFGQYVDLLGGIALRDQGFESVSRHADVLVPLLLKSVGTESALAVPSRHTGEALVQARHIRMPVPPGWTLWSLPLVARGVGELLRSTKLSNVPLAVLVPDVFGAYVLGPAYAFAAILLDFDPRDELDQRRAAAVFHVLRQTGAEDDSPRFAILAEEIEKEWQVAVVALGTPARPAADSEEDLQRLYKEVALRCDYAAYLAQDRWDEVSTLSTDLAHNLKADLRTGDLRDILNAMWLARWQPKADVVAIEGNAIKAAEHAITGEGRGRETQSSPGLQENR